MSVGRPAPQIGTMVPSSWHKHADSSTSTLTSGLGGVCGGPQVPVQPVQPAIERADASDGEADGVLDGVADRAADDVPDDAPDCTIDGAVDDAMTG